MQQYLKVKVKFEPDQSLFRMLHIIGEEGQETADHGYRRKVMERVMGVIKLGEKIQNILTCWT